MKEKRTMTDEEKAEIDEYIQSRVQQAKDLKNQSWAQAAAHVITQITLVPFKIWGQVLRLFGVTVLMDIKMLIRRKR